MTDMTDRIATVTMEDVETGEKFDMGKYILFPTGYGMITIVLVNEIEIHDDLPDGKVQVDVACKALDTNGMVYDLRVYFNRETLEAKAALLCDITINSVHIFHGTYGVFEGSLYLYDPEYRSVEPDFKEDEVREVFRVNIEHRNHVAQLGREKP